MTIYYIVLVQGVPESYGEVSSEQEFQEKKEWFKDFGCEIRKVSRLEYEKIKKKIEFGNYIHRKCFQIVTSGGETM